MLETYELTETKDLEIPMKTGYRKIQEAKQLRDITKFQSLTGNIL